jgi:hypothetical protein
VPLRISDPLRQLQELGDHLRRTDLLIGVAEHRLFQGLAKLLRLHQVRPLADLDLMSFNSFRRVSGAKVLLLERAHTLQEFVGEVSRRAASSSAAAVKICRLAPATRPRQSLTSLGTESIL